MTRPLEDAEQPEVVMASAAGKKGRGGGKRASKRDREEHHASTAAAAASAAAPQSMARGFARLDPETTAYYTEARDTFESLLREGDAEQASLLAGAALREAASSASTSKASVADVAADAVASRALESFLPHASSEDVLELARCVLADPQTLGNVATSPFGSHVAESLISRVAELANGQHEKRGRRGGEGEGAGEESAAAAATDVLSSATDAACETLYDLVVDRSGSHVLRSLLSALAGRPVEPARAGSSRGGNGGSGGPGEDGASFLRAERARDKKGTPATSLASRGVPKASAGDSSSSAPPLHAELVRRVARVALSREWSSDLAGLARDPRYSGPALQALLRASRGDEELVCELVPRLLGAPPFQEEGDDENTTLPKEGARLASIDKGAVASLARDRAGSHLLEAVLEASPRSLRTELDARFLRGNLAAMAEHPCANFVVQAALGAADSAAAVRGASRELGGDVARRLLSGSRGGVLLALVGAAGRVGRASSGGDEGGSKESPKTAADAAVAAAAEAVASALDSATDRASALLVLGEKPVATASATDVEATSRFSAVGCALLSSLLQLPSRAAASPYASSLASLPDAAFAKVAADGAGSRAVEALFLGPGLGSKAKKAAGKKLSGRLALVASTPGGVHAVERCYESAGAGGREAIAAELSAAARDGTLSTSAPRVVALMRKCGVVEWQQRQREGGGGGGGRWQQRAPAAPTTAEALLGEEKDEGASEDEQEREVAPPSAAGEEDEQEERGTRSKEPRQPRKRGGAKRAARAARAAAAIAEALAEQQASKKHKV